MATWTSIPDANLDPDKPARSIDALALRDNPVAIAEGATGAPGVRLAGQEDTVAGPIKFYAQATGPAGFNPSYTKEVEWEAYCSGTIRVFWTQDAVTTATVYKNGVAVGTERAGAGSFTEDVTFVSGDFVQIYAKDIGSAGSITALALGGDLTGGMPLFNQLLP